MKRMHKHLLTAGLLASIGLSAVAQPAPGPGGPHGPMDPARMQEMRARMEQRMNERMEFFKFKLKISPAQEGAWNAWTASMKPNGPRPPRPDRAEFERLSTPERIDRIRAMRATRQAEMDKRFDATKAFYAQLNPEQKRMFDQESMKMLGGGPRGGERHHRRG